MALFQHNLPEVAESPLPPAMPGETVVATPLHRLRLRQLQDLARAYNIPLPEGGTKNDVLPILVTHEKAGTFRTPPVSKYHLLHAEISHDQKLDPYQRADREQRLQQALETEEPAEVSPRAKLMDLMSYNDLQQKCKSLGINCKGKGKLWMQQAIADEEERREVATQAS